MIKKLLVILFLLLWFTNGYIALGFYPNITTSHEQWDRYVYLRENIYECMMFILLVLSFLTPTKSLRAFIVFSGVIVGGSLIGKMFQNEVSYVATDIIVLLFAVFFGWYIYKNNFRFSKI